MDDKNKEYIDDELLDNEEELQNSEDLLSSDQQMTSSRQKFGQKEFIQSEGKRDYYKNQAMMHKQRIDKAKEEANKSQKTVKDKKGNDIVKNKNFVDKMRDKKNLAQAKGASLGNKVSGLKSKAYTMMHPVDAIKMRILNYAKYKLLIGLGIIIAVIIIIGAFVALFTDGDSNNKTFSSSYSNSAYWWPIGSADVDENGLYSGQPVGVTITSDYGYRIHPISGKSSFHNAIDIGIPTGTPIIAMADGTVTKTVTGCIVGDYNCGGSCGNYVVLSHRDGLSTMYCHNSTVEVKVGDNVKQGQMIAKAGTTGSSTGPHLHFNIKLNGASVNPLDYVSASDPRPINMVGGDFGDFSLTETSLSKQEFIQAINNYYNSHPVDNYKKYLVNNADTIYTASKSAGINPELGGNNYVYYSESEYIYLGVMPERIESYVFTTEFSGENNCHTIDLSTIKLNIGRETLSKLFYNCTNLSSLTLPINLDISNVRSMSRMFYGCSSITEIDMSSWTNGNNIDMRNLFYSCSELTTLKMFPYTFTSDTKYDRMFAFTDLRLLDISGWDMTNFNADSGVLNIYNANLDENNRLTIICSEQTEQIIKSFESGTEYMDFVRPS